MKICIYLNIVSLVWAINVSALEPEGTDTTTANYNKHYAIKLSYQAGNVFPTNNFYRGTDSHGNQTNKNAAPIKYYHSASMQIGRQTDGSKLWQQLYAYPYWGIGLSGINFFNQNELGTPSAIYAFINAPFRRWEKFSLNYEIGFGIAFNWQPFNEDYNYYQIVIGSKKTAYFDAGLDITYQLSKRFNASVGYSLTHFSNGGIVQPDYGVNLGGLKIGIKYLFKDRPQFIKKEIPEYKKENEWLIAINPGIKQVIFDTAYRKYVRVNYKVLGITSTYNWQTHHKSKWGAGIDFSYDGAINAQIDITDNKISKVEYPFIDKFSIGIYPSYELVCNKLSIILQSGIYILRKKINGRAPLFYQRIGVKYHILQNAFIGINVRAFEFTVADYIEWSIGYRIKWDRN
ncbi:MAG: hypothetical protein B6D61_05380 [Bacteroidetes bacterium 4484_249]|nr:MAG: hypothetical protein B6D61_05380 [Bacteroidetes bacterium 4484_249]